MDCDNQPSNEIWSNDLQSTPHRISQFQRFSKFDDLVSRAPSDETKRTVRYHSNQLIMLNSGYSLAYIALKWWLMRWDCIKRNKNKKPKQFKKVGGECGMFFLWTDNTRNTGNTTFFVFPSCIFFYSDKCEAPL
jgi:hypothetical protein